MEMIERHPVEQIARLKEVPSQSKNFCPDTRDLFVYCSTPRAVHNMDVSCGPHPRPPYRDNEPKPKGFHSYYNISWDPRVRRGSPLQLLKKREQLECEKIRRKLAEPRKKKGKTQKQEDRNAHKSDPNIMIRTASMRYARLAISNLRPKEKDQFFVELTDELDQDEICYKGQKVGAARVLPKVPSRKRNLVEQGVQIWPKDFFIFDYDVIPVLERLVGAVCYQARMEVLEEAELDALKLQREQFEYLKRKEEEELEMFKARIEKQKAEEKRLYEMGRQRLLDEMNGVTSVSFFAGVPFKYNTEQGLEAADGEWKQYQAIQKAVEKEVVTWLNESVEEKMALYESARRMLDEVIRKVVTEREAQHAAIIWKDVFGTDPIRYFTQDSQSSRVPPPSPGSSSYYTSDEEGLEVSSAV